MRLIIYVLVVALIFINCYEDSQPCKENEIRTTEEGIEQICKDGEWVDNTTTVTIDLEWNEED